MPSILFVNYEPSEDQKRIPHAEKVSSATRINHVPGVLWKFWVTGIDENSLGGIYLFDTLEAARAFGAEVKARLTAGGSRNLAIRYFDVDTDLSVINGAPLGRSGS